MWRILDWPRLNPVAGAGLLEALATAAPVCVFNLGIDIPNELLL